MDIINSLFRINAFDVLSTSLNTIIFTFAR